MISDNTLAKLFRQKDSVLYTILCLSNLRYLKGGADSGFRHVTDKYENWKPRLFHCKGKRNVRCHQVDCNANSLNLGDVFILDNGLNLYVWMPPESGRLERIKGMAQAKNIRDQERMGKPQIHVLDEDWEKNEDFWRIMGGAAKARELKSAEAGGADENFWRTHKQLITLWRVSDESGEMKVTMVSDGTFKSSQLESKDAFILDADCGGIYVWIGNECTPDERKRAMQWATSYIQKAGKPDYTQVVRVLDGAEPAIFTQWASTWETGKVRPPFQPKLYQCSDESGKLIVEEIANFTQEDLDGDDVMILDGLSIIYVWVGANANVNEKKHAVGTAKKYLETDAVPRPKNTMIETIYQGSEGPAFKKMFKTWNDQLFNEGQRTVENVRKLMFS